VTPRGPADLRDRIVGCALGAAVGDALGCPFEFQPREQVLARLPGGHIDGLYPARGLALHPLGLWQAEPPLGVGTDDTRLSRLFLDLVAERGVRLTADDLARRYLDVWQRPGAYFVGPEPLIRGNLAVLLDAACGQLDRPSPLRPGAPPQVLRSGLTALGGIPTLLGLIALPTDGCLAPGDAERAYRAACDLGFFDIGMARDLTAVHAAAVAQLIAGEEIAGAVWRAVALNPYSIDATQRERLRDLVAAATQGSDAEEAARLAQACSRLHPFDPLGALATALSCLLRSEGDFRCAVLLAINQWELSPSGQPHRLRDVDCYGSITGALCGAACGRAGIPAEWLEPCRAANLAAYGFDIVAAAERFADRVVADSVVEPVKPG
jgi:ADP-ribosylglycohydrolase